VLLPESDSSARWEGKDHPALESSIKAALPGANVTITNANGSQDTQLTQAESDLTNGACILVVAPHDSAGASAIVSEAKKDNVPVISYDRLITDPDVNFYVSFDGVAVGTAQGQYISDHYKQYVTATGNKNIAFIDGSHDDNNALLFAKGAHNILDPIITSGALTKVYEQFTPGWDNPTARTEMEGVLTKNNNKIAVAYVMNDGMAGTVIAALTAQHLNGKVLVTGQDATVAGIQQILLGNQGMTVYKPVIKEAQATAQLVAALSNGTATSTIATGTVTNGTASTPSVLLPVTSVDKSNIATTVIADGYVTKQDVCTGLPAGTAPDICGS
jgi:D-xylose transport system substrate-binding protein